jgi:hypothetical protein
MSYFTNKSKYKFEIIDTPTNVSVTPSFENCVISKERVSNELFHVLKLSGELTFYGTDHDYLQSRIDETAVFMNVYEKAAGVWLFIGKFKLFIKGKYNDEGRITITEVDAAAENVFSKLLEFYEQDIAFENVLDPEILKMKQFRLTVDEEEDFRNAQMLVKDLNKSISLNSIIDYLDKSPLIQKSMTRLIEKHTKS